MVDAKSRLWARPGTCAIAAGLCVVGALQLQGCFKGCTVIGCLSEVRASGAAPAALDDEMRLPATVEICVDHREGTPDADEGVWLITQEVSGALVRALDAINSCSMRYAFVGGLAVSAWAVPRATRDADLWVELGASRPRLRSALEDAGFDVPAMDAELSRFGVFRSKDMTTGVFVDIFDAVGRREPT
jgi:hypothetical protein